MEAVRRITRVSWLVCGVDYGSVIISRDGVIYKYKFLLSVWIWVWFVVRGVIAIVLMFVGSSWFVWCILFIGGVVSAK